jgi:uncharacterized membrane protein
MAEKRSKYDTDPLDPDFVRQTDEMWGATRGVEPRPTDDVGGAETKYMNAPDAPNVADPQSASAQPTRAPQSEAPTQRMDEKFSQSYPSVFIPPPYQQPPVPYQQPQYQQPPKYQQPPYQQPYVPPPAGVSATGVSPERTISGLNIREKWATVLPYAPFYIGIVAALIELLMVPRRETRVRFHAAQGLALQAAILALSYLFTFIGFLTSSWAGGGLVRLAGFCFLIISMIRVWKGEEHRIGPLNDATKWLNERIDPRKS